MPASSIPLQELPPDDFIARASRQLEADREVMPTRDDGYQLLRNAAETVAEVNRTSPVPVTVTDYALLMLAEAMTRSSRRVQVF